MTVGDQYELNGLPASSRRWYQRPGCILALIVAALISAALITGAIYYTPRVVRATTTFLRSFAAAPAAAPSNNTAAPAATAPTATPTQAPAATATSVPTLAPSPVPTVDTDALAAEIGAGVQEKLPAGAPASVQQTISATSKEAATRLVQAGGTEEDAPAMAASLFNALNEKGAFCWADKTSTINEQYATGGAYVGPQRIEISQSQQNVTHVDYYRAPGTAAISILVRGGEEAVLLGHGSIWEFPGDRCNGFDFLEDLRLYAAGRPDWGHSGLVFQNLSDALTGKPALNPRNLTAAQIDALRPVLFQEDSAQLAEVRAVTGFTPSDREAQCKARREDYPPVQDQPWTVTSEGGFVVVNFWSNWDGLTTPGEAKFMIHSGSVSLKGGGSASFYPAGCDEVALNGYEENLNTPWNGEQIAPYLTTPSQADAVAPATAQQPKAVETGGGGSAAVECVAQRQGDAETATAAPTTTWTVESWEPAGYFIGSAGSMPSGLKGALWIWPGCSLDQVMETERIAGKTPQVRQ